MTACSQAAGSPYWLPSGPVQIHGPLPTGLSGSWGQVFEDNFNGFSLDNNLWTTCYWWNDNGCTIDSNNELEWYQPGNVSVREGSLILQAKREPAKTSNSKKYAYTSGMVTTGPASDDPASEPGFAFQYGYAEVRARMPKGRGLWPAFWLLPVTRESKPEIDVMEILGDNPREVKMFYHYIGVNASVRKYGRESTGPDYSGGWHTFGVHWSPDEIVWYVDGQERSRFSEAAFVPQESMYIIMNLAVGGDYPGDPDENSPFPSRYEIDYVRVYQQDDLISLQPAADSYIEQSYPKANYGSSDTLYSDGEPVKIMLVKYDTRGLAGRHLVSASVRVHTTEAADSPSNDIHDISISSESDWKDNLATFDNYLQSETTPVGTIKSTTAVNTVYEYPLDVETVQTYIGKVFTISISTAGSNGLYLYSTKSRRGGIQLRLEFAPD